MIAMEKSAVAMEMFAGTAGTVTDGQIRVINTCDIQSSSVKNMFAWW